MPQRGNRPIEVRVRPEEREQLEEAARRAGQTLSAFIRDQALIGSGGIGRAKRVPKEGPLQHARQDRGSLRR